MAFKYLRQKDIDRVRWDAAVRADPSRLPYGLSWWLDAATATRWDGLMADDYRLVLPLPLGRSIGRFTQVQRPAFTQQCGPFGTLHAGDLKGLLRALPFPVLSLKMPLSERTLDLAIPHNFTRRERTNFVLPISAEYDAIQMGFHKALRRKIRRNGPAMLSPAEPAAIIELYASSAGLKAGLKPAHYRRIEAIMHAARDNEAALCCRLDDDNGYLAAGFFPFYRGRLINTFAASTPAGYRHEGMARMIVELIKKHRGPGRLLDFEGSEISGVAEFFRSFGPTTQNYTTIEMRGPGKLIGRL